MQSTKNQTSTFYILIMLFFMWGFLTSMNDILVPHLKAVFHLKNWQSQLVQFFFFLAYFIMSVPAGILIKKIGYKKGIVAGLGLMGIAAFAFIPASYLQTYELFLIALFFLASGITLLQVAANPFVAVLGPSETAASRLNLAQGFNSIGHTIAPLIGAWLILQNAVEVDVSTIRLPYLVLATTLILLAILFIFLPLPEIEYKEQQKASSFSIWKHKHLWLGAIAIFLYVGAEVSVGSFLVEYFEKDESIKLDKKTAGSYVAFYWGGAMIGRFLGAITLGKNRSISKMILIPILAIVIVKAAFYIKGLPIEITYGFDVMVIINFLIFYFGKSISNAQLALFAGVNVLLLIITMNSGGNIAIWSVLAIGLFNSIMWSNIFTLAIDKLGKNTTYGSSFLVMMIVGGAILPLIQGVAADVSSIGLKHSFIVPLLAYIYLIFYGLKGYKNA